MTAAAHQPERSKAPPLVLKRGALIAGRLELLKRVASGGMGAVWSARNVTTGADVAVKVLHRELNHDRSGKYNRERDNHAADRFRHEAQLGAKLAHRNITRVFDLIEEDEDKSLVLVMELLQGQTLGAYYKSKRTLSNAQAVAIIVPILSALQHAHEHGVIHRDLKPSNIFLHVDPDGVVTPKLLDFGIAKAKDSTIQTRTGDALGTPNYMSPEQVRAAALDARSDVFAAAVVLYEVITGENPFQGSTASASLAQVLELDIDPHSSIEPRVWLEIRRALSKQSYERHGSAKEFASALCSAVGETESSLAASLANLDLDLSGASSSLEDDDDEDDDEAPAHERKTQRKADGSSSSSSNADAGDIDVATLRDLHAPEHAKRKPRALLIAAAAVVAVVGGVVVMRPSSSTGPSGSPKPATTEGLQQPTVESQNDAIDGGELPATDQASNDPQHHGAAVTHSTPGGPKRVPPKHSTTRPQSTAASKPAAAAPSSSASLARTPGF